MINIFGSRLSRAPRTEAEEREEQRSTAPHDESDSKTARRATSDRPASPEGPTGEGQSLSLDEVFEILKNRRRRLVLGLLGDLRRSGSVDYVTERIAATENDKEPRQVTDAERKRVYVALYQCHLPKMDDLGVIVYDRDRGTIEPGPQYDAVLGSLERVKNQENSNQTPLTERLLEPIRRR